MSNRVFVWMLVFGLASCTTEPALDDGGAAAADGEPERRADGGSGTAIDAGAPTRPAANLDACLELVTSAWALPLEGALAGTSPLAPVNGITATPYLEFNEYSRSFFGAEHEPLTREVNGQQPGFLPAGTWVHESRNSAAVGFETNLPTLGFVEYGPTSDYGTSTALADRYTYLHLAYLKDLAPGATYHYRLVAVDERGQRVETGDRTFETHALEDAIELPGALGAPPYVLDRANATYLVTRDFTAPGRAFTFAAAGVTLDLNGHEVVYDDAAPMVVGTWDQYVNSTDSSFGVMARRNANGGRLINGALVQGAQQSRGHTGIGFNPVYLSSSESMEVAGITAVYGGHSVGGMLLRYGSYHAHHNVIVDTGTGIDDRHLGIKALLAEGDLTLVDHNLIKRARHQGIRGGGRVHANEIYLDSFDTNSIGILPSPRQVIEHNRIFGTGYHVVGIGWALVDESVSLSFCNNFIHLQGDAPTDRSDESGTHSSVNGLRLTQYDGATRDYRDYLYEGNTIIVKGRRGTSLVRGTQFFSDPYVTNLVFRKNIVKTELLDEATTTDGACIVGHGLKDRAEQQLPVVYEQNRLISNKLHVLFGDSYAGGGNHRFYDNVLEKVGDRVDYQTIKLGWGSNPSFGNRFIDNETRGGADLEDNLFSGSASVRCDYSVGHSLVVETRTAAGDVAPGVSIEVRDSTGTTFSGATGPDGRLRLKLFEYTHQKPAGERAPSRVLHADHALRIAGVPRPLSAAELAVRDNENQPLVLVVE